ncbi:MAG: UDP-N-acetylglucosamine--N-acetylmuramyl-(pentapeptide) pyrophosphoryl-undecaprenol N-acetylglucosamine transferase [Acidimicrobiia bacterium]
MTFVIAAAGTGGHVYPGLAVGEALVAQGIERERILYVGGDRLEAKVYPDAGFPFEGLELKGLRRSLSIENLKLPGIVLRARRRMIEIMGDRGTKVGLGMGGYVTIPLALAVRSPGVDLMVSEQNKDAGLANRVARRWASRVFVSFPNTKGMPGAEWVGNPVRRDLAQFDRATGRAQAISHYDLDSSRPTLGVFGGSLGAGAINEAIARLVATWGGPVMQVVHLTGRGRVMDGLQSTKVSVWRQVEFEDQMSRFYAAADLVVARAGGGVAELTATGTPSILIPGEFGSAGHQRENARFIEAAGAALMLAEPELGRLPRLVEATLFDEGRLTAMREAASVIARPNAASAIAEALIEASK